MWRGDGLVVTGFICHVGWEVSADIAHRLLNGVDPDIVTTAEQGALQTPGVIHAHARARLTGCTLRVEVEGFVAPDTRWPRPTRSATESSRPCRLEIPQMRGASLGPPAPPDAKIAFSHSVADCPRGRP